MKFAALSVLATVSLGVVSGQYAPPAPAPAAAYAPAPAPAPAPVPVYAAPAPAPCDQCYIASKASYADTCGTAVQDQAPIRTAQIAATVAYCSVNAEGERSIDAFQFCVGCSFQANDERATGCPYIKDCLKQFPIQYPVCPFLSIPTSSF